MRSKVLGFSVFAAVWAISGCARTPSVREIPPHETLVTLVSDFYRFAQTDLYRCETPQDASGQNVFRATLERLSYYETSNPGRDNDIVDFVRGEAYERLGDFSKAIESFSRVPTQSDSKLAERASHRIAALRRLQSACEPRHDGASLSGYLTDLESRIARLEDLEKGFGDEDSLDAMLARRERERIETEYALALFRNRYVLDRGASRALEQAAGMIERHESSCRVQAHRLMLGEFYFELARDMTRLTPPDRLVFDTALFLDMVNAARKQFVVVSQADGRREKAEGTAMLDALEAFARKVRYRLE
ncbi:hypothetical protein JW916_03175 [Candidatus Sumerlaeota bacterium]|nr:hypothetical protein [Candidatus Sumerlaeota bacterium]